MSSFGRLGPGNLGNRIKLPRGLAGGKTVIIDVSEKPKTANIVREGHKVPMVASSAFVRCTTGPGSTAAPWAQIVSPTSWQLFGTGSANGAPGVAICMILRGVVKSHSSVPGFG